MSWHDYVVKIAKKAPNKNLLFKITTKNKAGLYNAGFGSSV